MKSNLPRRFFLQVSLTAAAELVIGCQLQPPPSPTALQGPPPQPSTQPEPAAPTSQTPFVPDAWIRIAPDGSLTVIIDKSEMGQGVETSLAMLVADELDADWSKVKTEFAPVDPVYKNPIFGSQATGGSTSIRGSYEPLRKAGAAARIMLIEAAAQTWGVNAAACRTEKAEVVHPESGRRLGYGPLTEKAAKIAVPKDPPLKSKADLRIIGTRPVRVDGKTKAMGNAEFGIDVRRKGMLTAVVARCPVFGGKVKSFDPSKAQQVKGVRKVFQIESGIAVAADSFWQAKKGAEALSIQWDEGKNAANSSESLTKDAMALAKKPGKVAGSHGDFEKAFRSAKTKLNAVYEAPYQAHAPMEPLSCTVEIGKDGCDIWAPTQGQDAVQKTASKITGLSADKIRVHTTYLGGAFGRKFEQDFISEALLIAKETGAPAKIVWSREDDIRHDFYRPASYNVLRAGLGPDGMPLAWSHRIVSPSIMSRLFPQFIKNGIDRSSVEGANQLPYSIPNILVDYHLHDTGVPVGFWRSVGHSQNAFVVESFLDELALAAKQDPYTYRQKLMTNAPRLKGVLDLATAKAGWGNALPKGKGRGIAAHESFGSFVAQVADVTVAANGDVKVDRVVCAIDCGAIVHPGIIEMQIESAIVYGLSAALKGEITIEKGAVKQANFHNFKLLRIDEMPAVEVHIMPSSEKSGGVGEPGTPPIAPAVCNAIFAATGKRIRKLPIRSADLKA